MFSYIELRGNKRQYLGVMFNQIWDLMICVVTYGKLSVAKQLVRVCRTYLPYRVWACFGMSTEVVIERLSVGNLASVE